MTTTIQYEEEKIIPISELPNFTPFGNRKTSCRFTKYEIARLLGTQATNISHGALPLVKINAKDDALKIARKELQQRIMPAIIRRHFADGTYEDWDIKDLIILK